MADPVTIKGGKIRVLLDIASSGTYTAPCGFTQKSLTFEKELEEFTLPDCDDPDAVPWKGRDAASLGISISGEGVLAVESAATWLDAWAMTESVPVKIEIEFPASTLTYTGRMHVGPLEIGAPNGRRVTNNATLSSDGEMVRTSSE
jgi:hypothetical protein